MCHGDNDNDNDDDAERPSDLTTLYNGKAFAILL